MGLGNKTKLRSLFSDGFLKSSIYLFYKTLLDSYCQTLICKEQKNKEKQKRHTKIKLFHYSVLIENKLGIIFGKNTKYFSMYDLTFISGVFGKGHGSTSSLINLSQIFNLSHLEEV